MKVDKYIQYWAHMLDEAFPPKKLAEAHIQQSSTSSNPLPPMTKQELQQIERKYGTTDNFQESGWILPDGELLQMDRTKERWTQHDWISIPDSYCSRAGISEDADISQTLMSAGFIRINFSNNPCTVDMRVKPTSAQMDRLYDLVDLDYSNMKDYYYKLKSCLDEFQLELPGKLIRYEDEDEFKKRFLNDIRNAFSYSLNESKATYLQKYKDEADAKKIVDAFWQIKSRLHAPENDIDWWIKKPFNALKDFVLSFDNQSNVKTRRAEAVYQEAIDNGAELLDERNGYEFWYIPTYDAMKVIGRDYKNRPAKWCVASDDPSFWYENYDQSEFIVLVRKQPKHDEFDKVAIQFEDGGNYFNIDNIVTWDLDNNDKTFDEGAVDGSYEMIEHAWHLLKDNGCHRETYY